MEKTTFTKIKKQILKERTKRSYKNKNMAPIEVQLWAPLRSGPNWTSLALSAQRF